MKSTRILIVIAAAALCCAPPFSPALATDRKPNVVFILADDLGYRELGCFGQKLIRTPNLDRLAKQGMRLVQHSSGNAVCAPSRCVLMTGKHPGHAWVRNNRAMKPEGQQPIPDGQITLAELMRGQGYVTGAFGKWGLGGPGSQGDPLKQGFDRFFGYNCQGQDYAPDRINEQAIQFIRANKDRPFFLYYPTIIPHVALHVPDEDLKPYIELVGASKATPEGIDGISLAPTLLGRKQDPRPLFHREFSGSDVQNVNRLGELEVPLP